MLEKTGNFNRDDKYKKQEDGNARNKKCNDEYLMQAYQ